MSSLKFTAFAMLLPAVLSAQSLSARVAAAKDGTVRFQYASRSNACGDGERLIRMPGIAFMASGRSFSMMTGRMQTDNRCDFGPAEAKLEVANGQVVSIRSALPAVSSGTGTQLGTVSTSEAATFFLDLLTRTSSIDDERLFMALLLADSTRLWPDLVKIAENTALSDRRRGKALQWVGWNGDPEAIPVLAGFLKNASHGTRIREGAAAGLSHFDETAASRALVDFVRAPGDAKLRSKVVHLAGDETLVLAAWRTMAGDDSVDDEVRKSILLVLGNSDDPRDGALLRSLLPKMKTQELRKRLLHALSQNDDVESARYLLQIGQSSTESYDTRKDALFWAGQSHLSVKELIAAYDRIDEEKLKEQMIFVLNERKETEATDKLIAIVKNDPDMDLRKKAIFWLGHRDDPKSAAFLRDLLR